MKLSGIPGFHSSQDVPRTPSINIEDPAAAIIAALSVQREIGGT